MGDSPRGRTYGSVATDGLTTCARPLRARAPRALPPRFARLAHGVRCARHEHRRCPTAERHVSHRVAYFFFSSRRRHTRSYGDWSSDVCSSDLERATTWPGPGRSAFAG